MSPREKALQGCGRCLACRTSGSTACENSPRAIDTDRYESGVHCTHGVVTCDPCSERWSRERRDHQARLLAVAEKVREACAKCVNSLRLKTLHSIPPLETASDIEVCRSEDKLQRAQGLIDAEHEVRTLDLAAILKEGG